MSTITDADLYWLRDAANSICGQSGNTTHQEHLNALADKLDSLRPLLQQVADQAAEIERLHALVFEDACAAGEAIKRAEAAERAMKGDSDEV